jgi:nicotinate-nucleotide adenylyltransferase
VRIGVFGGSFDPVHLGHVIVARAAAARLRLDQVRLVPAGRQPLKEEGHAASAADRLAMLQLAVAGDPHLVVDDRELRRPGPSYTIDTLRDLRIAHPDAELCLLVGADAAGDLPTWHEAAAIPALARVVVLTRPGASGPDHALISETLAVPAIDISATEIRARCRRGESLRGLVPEAVARYIAERRLYREGD